MITEIKLANIATYNSVTFTGLQRENFIYGTNGSGKTTLSNYLLDVSNPSYSDCSITWENNIPLQVLVYNKTFREKNFNSTGKIPGIFTIFETSFEITAKAKLEGVILDNICIADFAPIPLTESNNSNILSSSFVKKPYRLITSSLT